ncbi:energy transducer TonB [Loktanella agnita]|uniref:cell envelope integrity protein TolA n=1 Tax=Loktanella agnita TaxID=287097 RepID=UPI0039889D14
MATPGTYISAVGHVGLIGWLILGWGFSAEPLQFDTMDVSVVTGEEFEALQRRATTPDPGQAEPDAPVPPEIDPTPPSQPVEVQPTEQASPPDQVQPPVDENPPPPPPPAPPATDVADAPPIEPAPPAAPPATPDVNLSQRPTPRQADRVTSEIVAPPPPDAQVDDSVREEVVPDPIAEPEIVAEEQQPTAPEESTTEIVIEDEAPSGAVQTSIRPSARPSRPVPPAPEPESEEPQVAATEPEPEVETPPTPPADTSVDDAVAAALAAAQNQPAPAPAAAVGPPLTGLEESSFRLAVSKCWIVDNGSPSANVTVEVGFALDRQGKVVNGEVRLISSSGGDPRATDVAFASARRAILRCAVEGGGFPLPPEKYDRWREVVLTFDPSTMRLR